MKTLTNIIAFALSFIGMVRNENASYFAKSASFERKAKIEPGTNMRKAFDFYQRLTK